MSPDHPLEQNPIADAIDAAEDIRDPLDGLIEGTAADPGAPDSRKLRELPVARSCSSEKGAQAIERIESCAKSRAPEGLVARFNQLERIW